MMKKKLIILLLLLTILNTAYSQKTKKLKFNKFQAGLSYQTFNASSYINLNDSLVSNGIDLIDILDENGNKLGDTLVRYTHDFKSTTIALDFKYRFSEQINFSAYLPLSFWSYNEKYFRNSQEVRIDRMNRSRTRIDFIELSADYNFTREGFISGLIGKIRIPSGFEKGQYHNPDTKPVYHNEFLSDGAFEMLLGTVLGIGSKKVSLENEVFYNIRSEDFRDQIIINSYLGFSTVPNTKLSIFGLTRLAVSSFDNARPIVPTEESVQENNFSAGASFEFALTDEIITRFNYSVTLLGKNTWNYSLFNVYFGYRF